MRRMRPGSVHYANDNQPPRSRGERLRGIALSVLVILLIAGATGSFNIQATAGLS